MDVTNFVLEHWDTLSAAGLFIGSLIVGKARVHAATKLLRDVKSALEDKHITNAEWAVIKSDIDEVLGRKK